MDIMFVMFVQCDFVYMMLQIDIICVELYYVNIVDIIFMG